jgi:hypothetical protein
MSMLSFKVNHSNLPVQDMASQGDKLSDLKKRLEPWLLEEIKQEIQSANAATGWRRTVEGIRKWSLFGGLIGGVIFLITQYGQYSEFRGRTDANLRKLRDGLHRIEEKLADINVDLRKQLLSLRAQNLSTEPGRPENQAAAKELLAEAKQKSIAKTQELGKWCLILSVTVLLYLDIGPSAFHFQRKLFFTIMWVLLCPASQLHVCRASQADKPWRVMRQHYMNQSGRI